MLKRQSEEEKEAKRLERQAEAQKKAANAAAAAEREGKSPDDKKERKLAEAQAKQERKLAEAQAKAERQEQTRIERQRQEFLASPVGMARSAFERGDHLFQYEVDLKNTKAVVVPMTTATTSTSTNDPVEILNSVCNEGWELVNGSFVFHELGSESRDKFLASGQNIAVKGTVIGYYVFRRCEANRRNEVQHALDERLVDSKS